MSGEEKVTTPEEAADDKPKEAPRKDSVSDEDYGSDEDADEKELDDIGKDAKKDDMEGPKQPDSRWSKMKATLKEYGETSSCHGIPHAAEANTCIAAVVWFVILAFSAVGFVYLFSDTLAQYLAFDNVVVLNLGLEQILFPSVTLCNINPYKLSQIQAVPELQALLTIYESASNGDTTP